jgi:peroxiredoxin
MDILEPTKLAPDFTLSDTHDQEVTLSTYRGKQPVVLVFNRGFS